MVTSNMWFKGHSLITMVICVYEDTHTFKSDKAVLYRNLKGYNHTQPHMISRMRSKRRRTMNKKFGKISSVPTHIFTRMLNWNGAVRALAWKWKYISSIVVTIVKEHTEIKAITNPNWNKRTATELNWVGFF